MTTPTDPRPALPPVDLSKYPHLTIAAEARAWRYIERALTGLMHHEAGGKINVSGVIRHLKCANELANGRTTNARRR